MDLAQVSPQALGIDLGLKDLMTDSRGKKVEAQRAGHKDRVRAIHAKIANRRKDHLHKLSTLLVGAVNAKALAQTNMAKSVLDAGWSTFRAMLQYKCANAGVGFRQVNERYSTQECSACHKRTGPKGLEGLSEHVRDTNAALVI